MSSRPSSNTSISSASTSSSAYDIAKSPECLTPSAYDNARRQQSAKVGTFNLISTMIGGGALSLPFAVSQCGLVLGFSMLLLSAVTSVFSFDVLISSSRRTGAMTYQQIAYFAFGHRFSMLVTLLIFFLVWITSVAYCVLIGDLIKPVVCYAWALSADDCGREYLRRCVIAVGVCFVSPFCFMRDIKALRYTSMLSMASVTILTAIIIFYTLRVFGDARTIYYIDAHQQSQPMEISAATAKLWPTSWDDVVYVFPVYGLSFLCHFNIPQVHSELHRPTRKRIRKVLLTVTLSCTLLYCIIAFFGYFYAFQYTCGNILLNYDQNSALVSIGRLCLGFVVLFTFPLLILPARAALHNLLNVCVQWPAMNMSAGSGLAQQSPQTRAQTHKPQRKQAPQQSQQRVNRRLNVTDMGANASANNVRCGSNRRSYASQSSSSSEWDPMRMRSPDGNLGTAAAHSQQEAQQRMYQRFDNGIGSNTNTNNHNLNVHDLCLLQIESNNNEKKKKFKRKSKQIQNRSRSRTQIVKTHKHKNISADIMTDDINSCATTDIESTANTSLNSDACMGMSLVGADAMQDDDSDVDNADVADSNFVSLKQIQRQNRKKKKKIIPNIRTNFLSRSFSTLDSPLKTEEDSLGFMHCRSDVERLQYKSFVQRFGDLDSAINYEPSKVWLIIETGILILVSVSISFMTESVMVLWGLLGSTVGFVVAFSLPAAFFIKIRMHKGYTTRNIMAAIIAVISMFAIVLCTWQAISRIDILPCPTQPTAA